MATHPLLFDLGASLTTRDVARMVKSGGVAALPDAVRRGDAATYQEIRCKSALNRVKGKSYMQWSLNPYRGCTHGCHYCFARRYQTQLELNAGDDFASVIFVKTNFVEVLRRELDKPSWKKESIGFGTATDPYQPIEGTYKISRGVLEALRDAATPVGIVTKGPMIVRDIDVLQDLSARAACRVHISVPTVDEDAWDKLEPGVAHPMTRLRAVRQLVDAGIDCGVLMAPIVPGFSTQPDKIERTVKAIAESGATSVGAMVMHMDGGTRDHFMALLARDYPGMVTRYEQLYARRYVDKDYEKRVQEVVSLMRERYGLNRRGSLARRSSKSKGGPEDPQ
ncbi:MAG: radical SAM protein [Acidobacteriota bacterium]|nr:radical SAM protein [Acidobacteriota bacterium]